MVGRWFGPSSGTEKSAAASAPQTTAALPPAAPVIPPVLPAAAPVVVAPPTPAMSSRHRPLSTSSQQPLPLQPTLPPQLPSQQQPPVQLGRGLQPGASTERDAAPRSVTRLTPQRIGGGAGDARVVGGSVVSASGTDRRSTVASDTSSNAGGQGGQRVVPTTATPPAPPMQLVSPSSQGRQMVPAATTDQHRRYSARFGGRRQSERRGTEDQQQLQLQHTPSESPPSPSASPPTPSAVNEGGGGQGVGPEGTPPRHGGASASAAVGGAAGNQSWWSGDMSWEATERAWMPPPLTDVNVDHIWFSILRAMRRAALVQPRPLHERWPSEGILVLRTSWEDAMGRCGQLSGEFTAFGRSVILGSPATRSASVSSDDVSVDGAPPARPAPAGVPPLVSALSSGTLLSVNSAVSLSALTESAMTATHPHHGASAGAAERLAGMVVFVDSSLPKQCWAFVALDHTDSSAHAHPHHQPRIRVAAAPSMVHVRFEVWHRRWASANGGAGGDLAPPSMGAGGRDPPSMPARDVAASMASSQRVSRVAPMLELVERQVASVAPESQATSSTHPPSASSTAPTTTPSAPTTATATTPASN
jgi:hypothetical protein